MVAVLPWTSAFKRKRLIKHKGDNRWHKPTSDVHMHVCICLYCYYFKFNNHCDRDRKYNCCFIKAFVSFCFMQQTRHIRQLTLCFIAISVYLFCSICLSFSFTYIYLCTCFFTYLLSKYKAIPLQQRTSVSSLFFSLKIRMGTSLQPTSWQQAAIKS